MAQFYGTIKGQRGKASRLGSKSSGMHVMAASWQGAVSVDLWHDHETGQDRYEVYLNTHHGAGVSMCIATGIVGKPPHA